MKLGLFAAVALCAVGGFSVASAQDAPNWGGAYVGAYAGYGSQTESDNERILFDTNLDGNFGDTVRTAAGADAFSPGFCDGKSASALPGSCSKSDEHAGDYGVRAGYDWQVNNAIIGVVGEYGQAKLEDSVTAFSTTPAYYTFTRKLDSLAAIRLRGGAVYGQNLFYITGGVARGQFKHSFATSNGVNTFRQSGKDEANGYQLGGGYERMLGQHFTLGVEYIYTSLDDDDVVVRASGPAPATNPFILVNGAGTDFRRTQDRMGINSFRVTAAYRF